jgi:hypothetical protein
MEKPPLSDAEAQKEWDSDGTLAIEVGPWPEATPGQTQMWEDFDEQGALRILGLLEGL